MLDKVTHIAEQAATSVSRRQFLGRFGKGAMILATTAGAVLAFPADAAAGRKCSVDADCPQNHVCCRGVRCRNTSCGGGRVWCGCRYGCIRGRCPRDR
jgi:hypothetical protein